MIVYTLGGNCTPKMSSSHNAFWMYLVKNSLIFKTLLEEQRAIKS
jgi:hypothetical protein